MNKKEIYEKASNGVRMFKCIKTIKANDEKGIDAIFKHGKIRKGVIVDTVEFKKDTILRNKKGNLICGAGSSFCYEHFIEIKL